MQNEWISVNEKMPENETPVFVRISGDENTTCLACVRMEHGYHQWFALGYIHIYGVTEWRKIN